MKNKNIMSQRHHKPQLLSCGIAVSIPNFKTNRTFQGAVKRKKFVILFFVLSFLLFSFVSAQIPDVGDIQDRAEGIRESVEGNITKVKGFGDKEKYAFLTEKWKEILLRNKYVAGVDGFFTKINIVFLVLFGMKWNLSLQMFFAFLIWIATLLSAKKYMFFTENKGMKWLYALFAVILFAQINFFEYLGNKSFELIFYKDTILWKLIFFVVILGLIIFWWTIHRYIVKIIGKRRKKKKDEDLEFNQKKIEKIVKGIERGMS